MIDLYKIDMSCIECKYLFSISELSNLEYDKQNYSINTIKCPKCGIELEVRKINENYYSVFDSDAFRSLNRLWGKDDWTTLA